jgi:3-hydroxyacyl-[acyl-carrier-protein] dehydratase
MLDARAIRGLLPHRYPFILVDRVIEISEDGQRAVAIKNVSANEPFFQGHFPDYPIMPGVLIVEALAQAGGATLLGQVEREGKLAVLVGVDGFRFRRQVIPGDQLRLEVSLTKMRGPLGRLSGRATVDGQLVTEGEITFAITDRPGPAANTVNGGTASGSEG